MNFYCRVISVSFHQLRSHISVKLYPFCWIYSSLFYPSNSFVVSQRRSSFLIWTVVEITFHFFKDSVTMVTNSINTKAINLLMCTSCRTAFNPTFRTSLFKAREDNFFRKNVFCSVEACFFKIQYHSSILYTIQWTLVDTSHRDGVGLCVYRQLICTCLLICG